MYKKVSTDLNFVDREKQTEKFWEDNDIFRKSMRDRVGNEIYMFYDGPPTANGKPHIGHVLTRVIKDMIPRYRAMKGYMVPRKAGWDTHGLPVELEVEKKLGLDGKDHRRAPPRPAGHRAISLLSLCKKAGASAGCTCFCFTVYPFDLCGIAACTTDNTGHVRREAAGEFPAPRSCRATAR